MICTHFTHAAHNYTHVTHRQHKRGTHTAHTQHTRGTHSAHTRYTRGTHAAHTQHTCGTYASLTHTSQTLIICLKPSPHVPYPVTCMYLTPRSHKKTTCQHLAGMGKNRKDKKNIGKCARRVRCYRIARDTPSLVPWEKKAHSAAFRVVLQTLQPC